MIVLLITVPSLEFQTTSVNGFSLIPHTSSDFEFTMGTLHSSDPIFMTDSDSDAAMAENVCTYIKTAVREACSWLLGDAPGYLRANLKTAVAWAMEKLYSGIAAGASYLDVINRKAVGWFFDNIPRYSSKYLEPAAIWLIESVHSGLAFGFTYLKVAIPEVFHWLMSDAPGH